ncbi:endoribonuclease Dicer-like [Oppia nitens]|uniref:endoribonuclease Dicer-like n=1 Tax=Oppia nitens TaxID=1686743 RepID=UPI0023DAB019|nr:endoribonuclease Dicer-like [Oppia nitens]XP_054159183.1 endoribonuclease Dicer-like [Oppia nitens]
MASNGNEETVEYIPRPYQVQLYMAAKDRNIIACLGTGTGKTFIAILLMRDPKFAAALRGQYPQEAKRTVFIVPTRTLVTQQAAEVKRHFDVRVKGYTGDMGVDFYDAHRWTTELKNQDVIVMTAQILLNMLNHQFITFNNINLMIMDEVHWAAKKKGKKESGHPYKQIMKLYNECPVGRRPRVLGLSASLINSSMRLDLFDAAVKDLEETYCAECNTSEVAQYCGTNPEERVWIFISTPASPSPTARSVVQALELFIDNLKKLKRTDGNSMITHATRIKKCLTNVRNMLADPVNKVVTNPETKQEYIITMTWMGVWCTVLAIDKYISELSQYRELYKQINPNHSALFDHVIQYLGLIKSQFNNELNPIQYPMAAYDTASPKMYRLLEILETYRPIGNEKSQLCGIIFVAQRSVAKVLAEWLNKIKELKPTEFGFLNVDWVVGHSNRPGFESLVTSYTDKQQQDVIDRFRNESLNLIIATSVLEEGLDIRKCNVVIRYDRLNTFREYLQSKGRARAENACYYMMTSEEDRGKLINQLNGFADMEKHIENLNNISRVDGAIVSLINDEEDEDDDEQYIDERTGARVTSRTAISLIYRYCALLPSDSFTKLTPIFNIEGIVKPFKCSLKLPVNSLLKETIYGQSCKSKKGAKKSAAFEVCKQLHLLGELNERFLPISREQFIDKYVDKLGLNIRVIDKEDSDVAKVGTRARNQIYEKRLTQVFTSQVSSNYYLHRISMKFPVFGCFSGQYKEFGLITGHPIVNRCSFSVFAPIREYQTIEKENSFAVNVDFMPLTKLSFNESQLEVIRKFHLFTFEEVIGIDPNGQLVFNTEESQFNLLVVPLMTNKQIDWKFMDKVNNCEPIQLKTLSTTERLNFKFDAQLYKDCVFYPWYWQPDNPRPERPTLYDSLSVTNLTPMSPWKGKDEQYKTFEHYYLKKYNLKINNKSQQLLEGKMVKRLSQLKSFTLEKSDPNRIPEYFVPELLYIHLFPSSLWRQALCLPAVLYRLNHIFLTEELRQKIHLETKPHIGCLNSSKNELSLTLSSDIIEFPLIGIKRLHIDDLTIDCEGHPFDYAMDMNEMQTFVMPKRKKRRANYAISTVTPTVTRLGSNSIVTNLSVVNNNNNNFINRLLDFTEAVIKKFTDILNNIRISNPRFDLDKYELEILSAKSESLKDSELKYGETYPFIFTGDIMPYIERSYDCRVGEPIIGPSADVLLKALTLLNANDAFNLERLETMGDSFLKFATTAFLYYACPELDEGRLSYLRQIQICNCNLYYLGNRKGIANLLVAHKWYPKINWLPPSYHIDDECDLQLLTKTNDGYRYQLVNDKSIADSVEALIGAHLLVGGTKCALIFMEWLGLKISTKKDIDYLNTRKLDDSKQFQWLPEPKNPIWNTSATEYAINKFIMNEYTDCNLNNFEKIIDYTFNNKAFIIQAFTHSSNISNQFTDCYQRLEFLGDSVLDYLITYHIYNIADKKFSPGELTDLRSALVNNIFFANIAVKFNFHKYLKAFSPDLYHAINVFVKKFEINKRDAIYHCFQALSDEEVTDLEEVEIPKALGDIFESIAGAIYLDSGLSLDAVWKVFYKLLKPEIDYFSENIPKMPVRELREKCENAEFSNGEQISGRKIRVVLSANGHQYSGIGKNSKLAKIAASKSALKAIGLDKK